MEVYVIRHGESEANRKKAYAGWSPVPLTEKGRQQAALLGSRLKGRTFDAVFSSDLVRTRQTAELVLPGTDYRISEKLREIHVGRLEGMTEAEARQQFGDVCDSFRKTYDFTAVGGESEDDVRKRVAEFMEELIPLPDTAKIAIVGHHGTAAAMLSYVLGCKVGRDIAKLDNCAISCFAYADKRWTLVRWNGTGEETDRP